MTERTCATPGCERPARLKGLCGAHHQRLLRHGDVLAHVPLRGKDTPDGRLWCSRCQVLKSPELFHRNASTRTGREGVCIACVLARRGERAAEIRAQDRARRVRDHAKILARKRAAYHANPTASLEAGRAWRKANPDRLRMQIRAQNAARYARDKNAPGKATTEQIAARWAYYGDRCWMCGAHATCTDHVKPLARGGSNWPANLRPACSPCNSAKSDTWPYPLEVAVVRLPALAEAAPRDR